VATKAQIDQYVKAHYPDAVAAGKLFNLEPFAVLAHAALESGYGTSYQARHNNAYFGVTSGNKPANQYWDGGTYTSPVSGLTFRVYDSALDSFMDAAQLISSHYLKSPLIGGDAVAYFTTIANSKYISEANGDNRQSYLNNCLSAVTACTQSAKDQNLLSPSPSGGAGSPSKAGFGTPGEILLTALGISLFLQRLKSSRT